jgi:hypothetical protein
MAAQPAAPVTRTSPADVDSAAHVCATKRGTVLALIVLARPWQWAKNGLVLAALVFSHRLFRPHDAVLATFAMVTFCALSSFAYILNDISDREADRLNPEKRDRPLACGDLTVAQAACFAIALGAVATFLSVALGLNFLAIAALYVALQFGYSLWAKQYVVLDVIAVAIGFVLRAFGGGVAIGAEVSPWLVFITFVLAMLLVVARRRHELVAMGNGASAHRGVLAQYSIRLCDQMLAISRWSDANQLHDLHRLRGSRSQTRNSVSVFDGTLRRLRYSPIPLPCRCTQRRRRSCTSFDSRYAAVTDGLLWIAADVILLYS